MYFKNRKKINDYINKVEELKRNAREWGISEDEFDFTVRESLNYVRKRKNTGIDEAVVENATNKKSALMMIVVVIACCWTLFHVSKPAHNFVERNIQGAIYPFMKLYRYLTLPIIQYFPSLTELYDESCLLENPYFKVSEMECWPCENAKFVLNLTNSIANAHVGLPFIQKLQEPSVGLRDLQESYLAFNEAIDGSSPRVTSSNGWKTIKDVLKPERDFDTELESVHIVWRINRMEAGRALRHLLRSPRNNEIPPHANSVGIERFLLIDGPNTPYYALPATEGANVFLKQLSGQRLIVLEPSPECREACRRLSILLEEKHILWYNWWYWRSRSLPVANATAVSLGFMGSSV